MKFLPMLGHDLEMSCTKFHENRLIIDGEIVEKHALQIIVLEIDYRIIDHAQYREPRLWPIKKYILAEIIFFTSIHLTHMSGDLQV